MKFKKILYLQLSFFIYSIGSLCSKLSLSQPSSPLKFIIFYGSSLVLLLIFAIIWQQLLKNIELTVAYANKGITVLWGMIFGSLFFAEKISAGMIIGLCFVVAGIVLMVKENE